MRRLRHSVDCQPWRRPFISRLAYRADRLVKALDATGTWEADHANDVVIVILRKAITDLAAKQGCPKCSDMSSIDWMKADPADHLATETTLIPADL